MKLTHNLAIAGASLAVAGTALLAAPANAASVTDGLNSYTITTRQGTYNALASLLQSQPWWDNALLANSFAQQVNDDLGLPNIPANFNTPDANFEGPYFGYNLSGTSDSVFVYNWDGNDVPPKAEFDGLNNPLNGDFVWAVTEASVASLPASAAAPAGAAAVPTPALLPAMLGLGASIISKRKKKAEAAA